MVRAGELCNFVSRRDPRIHTNESLENLVENVESRRPTDEHWVHGEHDVCTKSRDAVYLWKPDIEHLLG